MRFEGNEENEADKFDEKLVFVIRKSTRNTFIAKLFLLFSLTALISYVIIQQSAKEYEKGATLTKEEYIANFDKYKANLIYKDNLSSSHSLTAFVSLIIVSFLIGSYELLAILIGLLIGKFYKQ